MPVQKLSYEIVATVIYRTNGIEISKCKLVMKLYCLTVTELSAWKGVVLILVPSWSLCFYNIWGKQLNQPTGVSDIAL